MSLHLSEDMTTPAEVLLQKLKKTNKRIREKYYCQTSKGFAQTTIVLKHRRSPTKNPAWKGGV